MDEVDYSNRRQTAEGGAARRWRISRVFEKSVARTSGVGPGAKG